MVAAAVVGGLATAGSAAYSANQAKKGAKAQVEAGDRASLMEQQSADKQLALQREIWEKQQADYKPYLEQGTYGINRLGDLMRNRTPIGDPSTPFYNYTAANQPVASQQTQQTPQLPTKQPNTTNWLSGAGSAGGLSFGLDGANLLGNGIADREQPVNPLIPNYDAVNNAPTISSLGYGNSTQSQSSSVNQSRPNQPLQRYQDNANGGFLNNPFDSYLASKGVANKFDSSNTRLDSLMKQGSGQLNNPFDSYLASKGLAGGKFDTNNPAYQFQLKQGQQALDRSSAARGMGYSGAQMKAAQEYGQGLASQQYDKEYNRASGEFGDYYRMAGNEYDRANQQYTNEYNRASGEFGDYFNRLAGLSQGGQQAAGSMAQAGGQYADSASNTFGNLSNAQTSILGQQANARASGYAANANALSGGLNSLTNLYGMSKYGGGNKNSLSSWLNSDM
jgi:hypothetical protein